MQKQLSLSAVKYAALLLIESNEQTTTLEVKGLLRDLGYFATQEVVSDLLNQAADELPLEYNTNGMFRSYTLPSPATIASASSEDEDEDEDEIADPNTATSSNVVSQSTRSSIVSYTRRDGRVIIGSHSKIAAKDHDWVVNAQSQPNVYFGGSLSRDDVRCAYTNIMNVDFCDTRASRFKS